MPGEVQKRNFRIVSEELARGVLEFASFDNIGRPASSEHARRGKVDRSICVALQHRLYRVGIVHTSAQLLDVGVVVDSDNQRFAHLLPTANR